MTVRRHFYLHCLPTVGCHVYILNKDSLTTVSRRLTVLQTIPSLDESPRRPIVVFIIYGPNLLAYLTFHSRNCRQLVQIEQFGSESS